MAIAFRSGSSADAGASTTSSLSINKPTGVQVGDIIILNCGANANTSVTFSCSGFTTVPGYTAQSNGNTCSQWIFYRVVDGTEGSTFSVASSTASRTVASMAAYSGVEINNPFAGFAKAGANASTTMTFPATTPTAETVYAVLLARSRNTVGTTTISSASSGFTVESGTQTCTTATSFNHAAIMSTHTTYTQPISTTVGPGNATLSRSSNQGKVVLLLRADLSGETGLASDVIASTFANGAFSSTYNMTTAYAGEVIVVIAECTGATDIPSISAGSLTFTQAAQQSSASVTIDIWYAYASSVVTAQNIGVNFSASTTARVIFASYVNAASSPLGSVVTDTTITKDITTTASDSLVVWGNGYSTSGTGTAATANTILYTGSLAGATGGGFGRSTSVVSSPGTFTAGLATPSSTYAIVAIELLVANTVVTISSNDALLSTTADNATITQDHVVASTDGSLGLTSDNTTISENYSVAVDDSNIALTEDATTITQVHIVPPADLSHATTADATTAFETNFVLTTQDSLLSLTEDSSSISQVHIIVSADGSVSVTEDATTISQLHILVASDGLLSLTEDATTITQNHVLPSADLAIALTEDATTILQNHILAGNDLAITLTADATTIDLSAILDAIDMVIGLTADATTISQNHAISGADMGLAQTADATTITQVHILSGGDLAISLTADNGTISQNHILAVADALASLSADATTINQTHIISSADSLLSLTEDATTVDVLVVLGSNDMATSTTLDAVSISQNHAIVPTDAMLILTTDNGTLSQNHIMAISDASIALSEDATTLLINYGLLAADSSMVISVDNVSVEQIHNLSTTDMALDLTMTNTSVYSLIVTTPDDLVFVLSVDQSTVRIKGVWYIPADSDFATVDDTDWHDGPNNPSLGTKNDSGWYNENNSTWEH